MERQERSGAEGQVQAWKGGARQARQRMVTRRLARTRKERQAGHGMQWSGLTRQGRARHGAAGNLTGDEND